MKNKSRLTGIIVVFVTSAILAACSNRLTGSEQGDLGYKAFGSIIKENKDKVGFHAELSHWGYTMPTGEKLEWTKDTAANAADLALVILADPFINAGLDVKKLDDKEWLFNPAAKEEGKDLPNRLVRPFNVSDKKQKSSGSEDAMRRIIRQNPSLIKYNENSKKYSISLGNGFEAQWTEKVGATESDIIFIINADSLIKAGVDKNKLQGSGWSFIEAKGDTPTQFVKQFKAK